LITLRWQLQIQLIHFSLNIAHLEYFISSLHAHMQWVNYVKLRVSKFQHKLKQVLLYLYLPLSSYQELNWSFQPFTNVLLELISLIYLYKKLKNCAMNSMYYIVINTHTNYQIAFSYWIKIVCYSKWSTSTCNLKDKQLQHC
jgi:hypothetical protein